MLEVLWVMAWIILIVVLLVLLPILFLLLFVAMTYLSLWVVGCIIYAMETIADHVK